MTFNKIGGDKHNFFKIHIQSKYFLSPWLTGSQAYDHLWRSVQWGMNISREGQKNPKNKNKKKQTSDSKTIFTWQYICLFCMHMYTKEHGSSSDFFLTLKFICPCHLLKVKNAFKYFDRIFHSFIFLRASEEGVGGCLFNILDRSVFIIHL